jgi:2-methylcitrate dehydratase PrpD
MRSSHRDIEVTGRLAVAMMGDAGRAPGDRCSALGGASMSIEPGESAPVRAVTQEVVRRARGYRFQALPADVIAIAKQCVLDWIGVTIGGVGEPVVRHVRAEVLAEGGSPRATLLGSGEKVSLLQAALVNGVAAHALDFDDVSPAMDGHPSAPVLPALLAVAEDADLDGPALLTAFVAGVETECRIGRLMAPAHYAAGWHATGTVGTFGAAAACASALGLDDEQWRAALGIAGAQAAGLKSMFGTMCKPLHAGKAAANGLLAARLAARGFTSDGSVLDTPQGFALTQTTSRNAGAVLDRPAADFDIRDVIFKDHAACFFTHSSIEGVRRLVDQHGLVPDDVTSVRLMVPPQHLTACNIPSPVTPLEGKFSLRFTAALALAGVRPDIHAFTEARLTDPVLTSLRDRVQVIADPAITTTSISHVQVTTGSGQVLTATVDVGVPPRGEQIAARWIRLADKCRSLVADRLGADATAKLIDAVAHLDDQPSIRRLARLTVPGPDAD